MNVFFLLLIIPHFIYAVDRSDFKTCEQSSFCKRHRIKKPSNYVVKPDAIIIKETSIEAFLIENENQLKLTVTLLNDSRVRITIDEAGVPLRQRFNPSFALNGVPEQSNLHNVRTDGESTYFFTKSNGHKIIIFYNPFRIDVYDFKDNLILSVNSRSLLKFEHFRLHQEGQNSEDGFWEESFKNHADSKPYGSSSIGIDVSFLGFKYLYGLPEHADSFVLKSTTSTDPYRLYNVDVFEYEINSNMALYGSVPFVLAHNTETTIGALWLNAAETWVDIQSSTADKGVLAKIAAKFRSSNEIPQVDTHFISESGLLDIFLMLGPTPKDIFRQNAKLTGFSPLPPLFSLGYHQCRWNYIDEADVKSVHDNFDKFNIPLDVIWLDIEFSDSKKYFLWDSVKFPTPQQMIQELDKKSRKLVVIHDPHIKRDNDYFLYKEASEKGYFIKKADGVTDYDGHCWPGSSSWLDFLNPEVSKYWSEKYLLPEFQNTYTWNDMNEPSVFSGPEITLHKDAKHYGGWEHREIHNVYGFLQTVSTYQGHLLRSNYMKRPFILSRSFFVGSQRFTSVWTGDNKADWTHLQASIPMLLSLSVSGIPQVGADVGGFFGNPDEQLLVRWYQAAAFQPFFRSHAHIDTKRREPYLFNEETRNLIRAAIVQRYSFLLYWYTLFYEHLKTGFPVIRPLWVEFSKDEIIFEEEKEFMLGSAILIRPITEPDVTKVSIYLPGVNEVWYDWDNHMSYFSPGALTYDTPINKIPVFQRGGTILSIRERVRRSTALMRNDPITLYIAIEATRDYAYGTIYLDDGETFNYVNKSEYLYWSFTYNKLSDSLYKISSQNLDPKGIYDPDIYIDKIIIRGVRFYPRNIHLFYNDYNPEDLEFTHNRDLRLITIRKPGAYISRNWRIDIHT